MLLLLAPLPVGCLEMQTILPLSEDLCLVWVWPAHLVTEKVWSVCLVSHSAVPHDQPILYKVPLAAHESSAIHGHRTERTNPNHLTCLTFSKSYSHFECTSSRPVSKSKYCKNEEIVTGCTWKEFNWCWTTLTCRWYVFKEIHLNGLRVRTVDNKFFVH